MFNELAAATDKKGRDITDYQEKCDNHAVVRDYEKRRDKVEARAYALIEKWARLTNPVQDLETLAAYRNYLIEEADFKVTGPDGHVYAAVINHPDFAKEKRVK